MVANVLCVEARVAMQFLGCSGWLLRFLFEDVWADTRVVMQSLRCSTWLLRCNVLVDSEATMQLLGCCEWLLGLLCGC